MSDEKPSKRKRKSLKGKGPVGMLVLLFVASAGIRLMSGAGAVMAEVGDASVEAPETTPASMQANAPDTEELSAMLQAFQRREERIVLQEEQIAKRMAALRNADERINAKLVELKAAETELRSTLALATTAAEDDLARLTTVYENMKPKTAAALFEEMAPEFAAGFLGRMRPDAAASVMAGMSPEAAYTVSTILAGRNANVPKE